MLVILLLSLAILVGLVLFVYNLGEQVNRRLELQDTADAVAISGAGWLARSMNVVAMNNVAQARLIALVPVLDALPLALEMTLADAETWEDLLDDLVGRIQRAGVPSDQRERTILAAAVNVLVRIRGAGVGATTRRSDILTAANEALSGSGFTMDRITHWPDGALWRAAVALGQMSEAAAATAGTLAEHNAIRFGRACAAESAFVLPVSPAIPYIQGSFKSFQPVLQGRLKVECDAQEVSLPVTAQFEPLVQDWRDRSEYIGGAIPYGEGGQPGPQFAPYRLGPFFAQFRWREPLYEGGQWRRTVPLLSGGTGGTGGGSRIGGRIFGRTGYWNPPPKIVGHYSYGPYSWALRRVGWFGQLWGTYFREYLGQIADIKLNYMFEGGPTQKVHYPDWIDDYERALAKATQDPTSVYRTRMYRVRIVSSVPRGSADWLGQTTYTDRRTGREITSPTFMSNQDDPDIWWWSGWRDPDGLGKRLGALPLWENEYTGKLAGSFPQIGLPLEFKDDGAPVEHTIYYLDWWIFGGIDIGEDVDVSDPSEGHGQDDGPRPILLDTAVGDYQSDPDAGIRRELFTVLGVAGRSNQASAWPARFAPASPHGQMVAVAQARLFNNVSWDLWTQAWDVKLAPVTGFGPETDGQSWKAAMQRAAGGGQISSVDGRGVDLQPFAEYFQAIDDELADKYLNH